MRCRRRPSPTRWCRGNHLPSLHALVARCDQDGSFHLREEDVAFGPCVAAPQKILMVGMNYRHHCAEIGQPVPQTPVFFNKYNNALMGHRGTLSLPVAVASQFDHEAELVVVLGRSKSLIKLGDISFSPK